MALSAYDNPGRIRAGSARHQPRARQRARRVGEERQSEQNAEFNPRRWREQKLQGRRWGRGANDADKGAQQKAEEPSDYPENGAENDPLDGQRAAVAAAAAARRRHHRQIRSATPLLAAAQKATTPLRRGQFIDDLAPGAGAAASR
jgi:hypothetical protein